MFKPQLHVAIEKLISDKNGTYVLRKSLLKDQNLNIYASNADKTQQNEVP